MPVFWVIENARFVMNHEFFAVEKLVLYTLFYRLKSYIRIINNQVEQSKTTYNENTIHE